MERIPKESLIHGVYYTGDCRNASIARWDAYNNCFVYRRYKFGQAFLEALPHYDDRTQYDWFDAWESCSVPALEIPINKEVIRAG